MKPIKTKKRFKPWHFTGDAEEFEKKHGKGNMYSSKIINEHKRYIARHLRAADRI